MAVAGLARRMHEAAMLAPLRPDTELPPGAAAFDASRATVALWSILGLHTLGRGSAVPNAAAKSWFRSCLGAVHGHSGAVGFADAAPEPGGDRGARWRVPQTALTYASIVSLLCCGDDLEWLDAGAVSRGLAAAQSPDGCVGPAAGVGGDIRFVYAALAAEHVLACLERARAAAFARRRERKVRAEGATAGEDQGAAAATAASLAAPSAEEAAGGGRPGLDRAAAVRFVLSCQAHDGGFGLKPGLEAHGGATYCAVSALALAGALPGPDRDAEVPTVSGRPLRLLVSWLSGRATPGGGFEGRPGRGADVCYGWWIGAALKTLLGCDADGLGDEGADRASARLLSFTMAAQDLARGGFGKNASCGADPLHSAYALAGIALCGSEECGALGLSPTLPATGVPSRVASAYGVRDPRVDVDGVWAAYSGPDSH